jgi:fibronectin type 3 domain-containing protein
MFNIKTLNSQHLKKAALAFTVLALPYGLSCGKRAVPLPPVERIQQRAEISGNQRGSLVILSWVMPARNASSGSIINIDRVDVYRLIEPLSAPLSLTEESFVSRSTLIASVPVSKTDFAKKQLSYSDTLEFAGQSARLRYAIRFVNDSGQKAAFSNFLLIEPTSKVADKPNNFSAEVLETAIKLNWNSPEANVDGSKPANILGYNVYVSDGENEARLKNATPVTDNEFFDKTFQFGTNYKYFVRTVSLGSNGEPIESLSSDTIEVSAKDIFAPSAPSALTIAAAPNNLSIFFAVNPERDIAGYNVYRSTNSNQNKSEWILLTPDTLKTNTFQDTKVESGKTYYYYLTAVDIYGNTSKPSDVVSETVP